MDLCGQGHALAALPPGKRPGNHCIGGWVRTRAGLDGCRKTQTPPGFDPRIIQPVASRYTDYAILISPNNKGPQRKRYKAVFKTVRMTRICHFRERRVFGYAFLELSA